MDTNPLVSVIIPTYNRADKVGKAISSVMNQTYKKVQIIVIDDGSTDATNNVVQKFPEAEYIIQQHAGQAAARNNGLQRAKGDLIASLDSDDIWHEEFLSHCVAKIKEDNLDFVFTNWIQKTPDNSTRNYLKTYPNLAPFIKDAPGNWIKLDSRELRAVYLKGCPSPSSSAVIRKSSIYSGWENKIQIGDDWCLFLDMILHKPCSAAFCLEQLWTKDVNDINIYDGRAWNEFTDVLYVKDLKELLIRYKEVLSEEEEKSLEALHLEGMLSLSIYHLFQKKNIGLSMKFMKEAFSVNAVRSMKIFPGTIKTCFHRRVSLKIN